jgi:calcineurin-like phosphoesterase family protein
MIYVTSDLHFQHANILKHQPNREFNTIEEMDEFIIKEWNRTATDKDDIYIVGDVSFRGSPEITAKYLRRLNGSIFVVPGNHDYDLWKVRDLFKAHGILLHSNKEPFNILPPIAKVKHRKTLFIMCHYPMETWEGANRDIREENNKRSSIHLHGHNHGKNTPCP